MSSSYLEIVLLSLRAHVERLAAELHDLDTPPERLAAIRTELRDIHDGLVLLLRAASTD